MRQYIVQKGDTVLRIAGRYGLGKEQLLTANPWAGQQPYLLPGQVLYLPAALRRRYVIQSGDTPESAAKLFHTDAQLLKDINPGICAELFHAGRTIVLPAPEPKHRITLSGEYGPQEMAADLDRLTTEFPFIRTSIIGTSVMGKPIYALSIGSGSRALHVNASLHANEWITTPCLLRFAEQYAAALAAGQQVYGKDPLAWFREYTLWLVPMANPDGVELVQEGAYPQHPFRQELMNWNDGREDFRKWKGNIRGVDLGDQFPAGWEEEVRRRGRSSPAPQDYPGKAPLSEPEAQALARHTVKISPERVISLHSQGQEIYWNYRDYEPPESEAYAVRLGQAAGYRPVKLQGSDAGYKDWFIQFFGRAGFTVEIGKGVNPLPLDEYEHLCVETGSILAAFMSLDETLS